MTGNELKLARITAGLTLEDVGAALGLRWQTVQKWESRGHLQVSIRPIYWSKLGNILKLTADMFMPQMTGREEESVVSADNGSVIVQAGRDATMTSADDLQLTPLERQAIVLNREVGNTKMLKGFIARLQEMQSIAEKIY